MKTFLFILITVFAGWIIGVITVINSVHYSEECCETILNDNTYKVDTMKVIHNNDTTITYKLIKTK